MQQLLTPYFTLLYTIVNIPYCALGGVITNDPTQRISLQSWRFVLATAGGMLSTVLMMPLVKSAKMADEKAQAEYVQFAEQQRRLKEAEGEKRYAGLLGSGIKSRKVARNPCKTPYAKPFGVLMGLPIYQIQNINIKSIS